MAANPTIATATGDAPARPSEVAPASADAPALAILKQYWPQLKRLLPSHVVPDAWYSAVYAALYRGRDVSKQIDLWRCANGNPESLMFALFDAARQGLEPGTEQYYLTPRRNNRASNGVEVLGIRGYQGEIELIYRAGAVSSVVVEVVRENDEYRYERGIDRVPVHRFPKFARKADRGDLIGCYAYGVMVDGSVSRVIELNQDDIDRAKRASGTAKFGTSFWNDPDDEVAMWLKTGVHRLQKFVPTSAEYRRIDTTTAATAQAVGAAAGKVAIDTHAGAALPDAIAAAQRAALPGGVAERAPSPLDGPVEDPPAPPLDESQFAQPPAPEDDPDADARGAAGIEPDLEVAPPPSGGPASQGQHRAIMRLLGKHLAGDDAARDGHRHAAFTAMLARPVASGKELTTSDATFIHDRLTAWDRAGELAARIGAMRPTAAAEPEMSDDDRGAEYAALMADEQG